MNELVRELVKGASLIVNAYFFSYPGGAGGSLSCGGSSESHKLQHRDAVCRVPTCCGTVETRPSAFSDSMLLSDVNSAPWAGFAGWVVGHLG